MEHEIYNTVQTFENNKSIIKKLEKENEILKNSIKDYMKNRNIFTFRLRDKTITIKTIHKSFVNQGNLPRDIWERYATITEYETLNIKKKTSK